MNLLLYGYGVSGKAVAEFCRHHSLSYLVVLNNEEERNQLEKEGVFALLSRDITSNHLASITQVIRSPGIPYHDTFLQIIRKEAIPIWSELELAFHFNPKGKYLVISGSNGKTTTVEFLRQLLLPSYPDVIACGNIGTPLISYLDQIKEGQLVIIEASNFQLETMPKFHPFLYGITNLSPNHLDKVPSLEWYYTSKCELANRMGPTQTFLWNKDDLELMSRIKTKATIMSYSQHHHDTDCTYQNGIISIHGEELIRSDCNPLFAFPHNIDNLMLAILACLQCGITLPQLRDRIPHLQGVRYRMEPYQTSHGQKLYHDGKSSTPSSTISALSSLKGSAVRLILGGYNKHLDFLPLVHANYVKIYAYGACRDDIAAQCPNVATYVTLQEAFVAAQKEAKNEEVILYSPGCASFDQYLNYHVRCEEFERLVKSYGYERII